MSATLFSYGSAAFAFAAAGLWFWSARAPIPPRIRSMDFGRVTGEKEVDDLDRTSDGLAIQGLRNAYAAVAAGVAALLQALALLLE